MTKQLEAVLVAEPVTGWKQARVPPRRDKPPYLMAMHSTWPYPLEATAQCLEDVYRGAGWRTPSRNRPLPHKAPHPHCGCGFYALKDRRGLIEGNLDALTLQVELTGRVIEHTQGYRAQHQKVVAAWAHEPADECARLADWLGIEVYPKPKPETVVIDAKDAAHLSWEVSEKYRLYSGRRHVALVVVRLDLRGYPPNLGSMLSAGPIPLEARKGHLKVSGLAQAVSWETKLMAQPVEMVWSGEDAAPLAVKSLCEYYEAATFSAVFTRNVVVTELLSSPSNSANGWTGWSKKALP